MDDQPSSGSTAPGRRIDGRSSWLPDRRSPQPSHRYAEVAFPGVRSPVTVAGPRRIHTGFLHCRRRTGRVQHAPSGTVKAGPGYPPAVRTVLHLVRHGQSEWNAEGRLQGQTAHVPLTALGRAQAEAAAEALRGSGAGALYTSDLTRAVQTAAPIARVLDLTAVPEPALREQALGTLEGRLTRELPAPEQVVPPEELTTTRWGGGESLRDVYQRIGPFLDRLLADPPSPTVVLVSHGDTIRVAVAYLRGRGVDGVDWAAVPNGSVTTVHTGHR